MKGKFNLGGLLKKKTSLKDVVKVAEKGGKDITVALKAARCRVDKKDLTNQNI